MKKMFLAVSVALLVTGCGSEDLTPQQLELTKLRMQQEHELRMARTNNQQNSQVQYEQPASYSHEQQGYSEQPHYSSQASGDVRGTDDGGSSILGTVAAVGVGALAGYAASELLDNGHRTYTDSSGRVRYVDKSGREIKKSDYDAYKKANPKSVKLSEANQKAKAAINTGATKVVDTSKNVAKKVDQKVVQPTKKKASSFKKSASSKRR